MSSLFSRPSSEIFATPAEAGAQRTSEILSEAILASSSSVRDSLPEQHRAHFGTLRQEIIDFAQAHGIPRESLTKPDALREAASKLSIPNLQRLANLLERFEHLLVHHEPKKEDYIEALEHAERLYHLKEQYDAQVELLKQVDILHPRKESRKNKSLSTFFRSLLPFGKKKRPEVSTIPETPEILCITGIDGKEYPIPTLEQIASRLFERHETLETKHDQGFTKLLLVPFGMSLDALIETLKQFLLKYNKDNPSFELDTNEPLWIWSEYQGADMGGSPELVYHPQSFTKDGHGGKTKMEILGGRGDPAPTYGRGSLAHPFPGWTIHLLQPSNPDTQDTETPIGFAPIPRKGRGIPQGDLTPRPSLEAGKTPTEYLSLLQKSQDDPYSPYSQESGMTPEDWIMAFMTHLTETKKPLDDVWNITNTESISYLTGAFFPSSVHVPIVCWYRGNLRAILSRDVPHAQAGHLGARFSVMV